VILDQADTLPKMDAMTLVRRIRNGERPTIPKPTVDRVLPLVDLYYALRCTGGACHIVLDDGNEIDAHAAFCLEFALRDGSDDEPEDDYPNADEDVFMAWVLTQCSATQRLKLYRAHGPGGSWFDREGFWKRADDLVAEA
jgi:hypothetical protein